MEIVSGGQTGVDRAALDAALVVGLPCGGWCPLGRRAEDGRIPDKYPLKETKSEEYPVRTEANVRDSDGTLILTEGEPDKGTALTLKLAKKYKKPHWILDLAAPTESADTLFCKITLLAVQKLNVAGPRESSCRGIYARAYEFLRDLFSKWKLVG